MADNYVLFSTIIPRLTPQEQAWVTNLLDSDTEDNPPDLAAAGMPLDEVDVDDWPGFQWEIRQPEGDLWLYAEDSGNVQHVGHFVRAFLARFRPNDRWQMTWAETCSKPRIGEFGGGGVFASASSVRFFSAHDWLARRQSYFDRHRQRQA